MLVVLNGMVVSAVVVVVVMIKLLSAFLVLGKHVCVCVCVCVRKAIENGLFTG